MPFVRGYLRLRRKPGRPGQPLPPGEGEEDMTPEWGIPEGELPEVEPPDPPPGVWPPPVPGHPIVPVPPGDGTPPGTIWPPVGSPGQPLPSQKLWLLAYMRDYGFKYVCVDTSLIPPLAKPKPN